MAFSKVHNHPVFKNFSALTVLSGLNYLVPLIALPYILRVVGIEVYGQIAFAVAFIGYFIVFVDYGFTLTATRDIAKLKGDVKGQCAVFNSVLAIKFVFLVSGFITLVLLTYFIPILYSNKLLFYAAYSLVVGNVLMPVWFFQGIEKMAYITIYSFLGQIVYLCLLLTLVKSPGDYILVPASQGIGLIVGGMLGIFLAWYKHGMKFRLPSLGEIKLHVVEGWDVFVSRVFLNLYSTTNLVILGILTTPVIVGQYAVAEKIKKVFMVIPNAINQAVYPFLTKKYSRYGMKMLQKDIAKVKLLLGAIGVVICIIAIIFAHAIISLMLGEPDQDAAFLLQILAIAMIANPFGSLYTNLLIMIGEARIMRNILAVTAILSLALAVPAVYAFEAVGLAAVVSLITIFVVLFVHNAFIRRSKTV